MQQYNISEFGCNLIINTNEDNPDIVRTMLPIPPTSLIVKGEQKTNSKGILIPDTFQKYNLWIYKEPKLFSEPLLYLNNSIEKVVNLIEESEKEFLDVIKKFQNTYLLCYAYYYSENEYFKLDKSLIIKLSYYNLSLEFDIYCLRST